MADREVIGFPYWAQPTDLRFIPIPYSKAQCFEHAPPWLHSAGICWPIEAPAVPSDSLVLILVQKRQRSEPT